MFFVMFYPIKYIASVIKLPKYRIFPVIILLCVIGAYSSRNGNMFDVWTMLFFGLLGYFFVKIKLPIVPFLIGFILGKDLEKYFVDSIKGVGGSLSVFFTRPMGWVIWGLIVASIAWAVYDSKREARRAAAGNGGAQA